MEKKNDRKKNLLVEKWGRNIDFHMLPTILANALQESLQMT